MREILFGGKRIDNGEWIEGSLLVTKFNTYIIPMYDESIVYQKPISVDSETVGQFTGLTDKNGVRIFEGDIIGRIGFFNRIVAHNGISFYTYMTNKTHDLEQKYPLNDQSFDEFDEIIDNIHDSPELLK